MLDAVLVHDTSRWRARGLLVQKGFDPPLRIAIEQKIKTIAFPAISTGMYGYPKEAAAKIALSIMKTYESSFTEIVVCCFSTGDVNIYYRQLLKLSASII